MLRRVALSLFLCKDRLNAERGIQIRDVRSNPAETASLIDRIHRHVLARLVVRATRDVNVLLLCAWDISQLRITVTLHSIDPSGPAGPSPHHALLEPPPSTMFPPPASRGLKPEPVHDLAYCKTLPDALDRQPAGRYPHPPPRGAGEIRFCAERVFDAGLAAGRVSR